MILSRHCSTSCVVSVCDSKLLRAVHELVLLGLGGTRRLDDVWALDPRDL